MHVSAQNMATSLTYRFHLPLLMFFLFRYNALSDKQTEDLINYICHQMEEFGFCYKTFNQNLPAPSTDIVGLTKITIDQALKNSTKTHNFIVKLIRNTTDEAVKSALAVCKNGYRIVEQSFQEAYVELENKDYKSVVQSEQGTPRAQGSCDTSINIPPYPRNPLVERNRQMRILIAMALVTAHILEDM